MIFDDCPVLSFPRFLSEDPFAGKAEVPPSLHKYLYAYQNPTVYIDPDGRETIYRDTAEDGSVSFSDTGNSSSIVVKDSEGREQRAREEQASRDSAIAKHQENVREGQELRSAGTNPACATPNPPQNCAPEFDVDGSDRQVTSVESHDSPSVVAENHEATPGQEYLKRIGGKANEIGRIGGDFACDVSSCSIEAAISGELPSGEKLKGWERVAILAPFGRQLGKGIEGGADRLRFFIKKDVEVRASYLEKVDELDATAQSIRAAGVSSEDALRLLNPIRNQIKLEERAKSSWFAKAYANATNLFKYGNVAGPSADDLYRQHGSWERALESLAKTRGNVNRLTGRQ